MHAKLLEEWHAGFVNLHLCACWLRLARYAAPLVGAHDLLFHSYSLLVAANHEQG